MSALAALPSDAGVDRELVASEEPHGDWFFQCPVLQVRRRDWPGLRVPEARVPRGAGELG